MEWLLFKDWLAAVTGLSEDALHIYAALFIQIGVAALIRRSVAHLLPWLCVLLVLLANEAADIYLPGHPVEPWQIEVGGNPLELRPRPALLHFTGPLPLTASSQPVLSTLRG